MDGVLIGPINAKQHLEQVISLGDSNSKTLGFFTRDAFQASADKGHILTAIDPNNQCVGYLLYRIAKERAVIVHLCISNSYQGKGLAKKLVDYLAEQVRHLRGISLKCRKDYKENSLWPKLGFTPQGERPGRAKEGSTLVSWWMDLDNPSLFSYAATNILDSKTCVVIDANILFDLADDVSDVNRPSHALFAEWLEDVEFCLTKEIDNEIQRQADPSIKAKSKSIAAGFHILPYSDRKQFLDIYDKLKLLWQNKSLSESDESDIRQIAWAICSDAPYFITRDENLIKCVSEAAEDKYNLKILHPTEFIIHMDELLCANKYQPVRFAGTTFSLKAITESDFKSVAEYFQNAKCETKSEFLKILRSFLSGPDSYDCVIVKDSYKNPHAMVVFGKNEQADGILNIPMIRICTSPLASTISYQIVYRIILRACKSKLPIIKISDRNMPGIIEDALVRFGFFETFNGWTKVALSIANTSDMIAKELLSLSSHIDVEAEGITEWVAFLQDPKNIADNSFVYDHENYLWPAKFSNSNLPAYIIPIQSQWAEELFDEGLSSQGLFGRKHELALNVEAAYYRSARGNIEFPGRILWYVSKSKERIGTGHIRACSCLDYVDIDIPKTLYKKYRRLGIFEWDDVFKTAGNNLYKPIMAIKFSGTESFVKPVSWSEMQLILEKNGINSQIQQPQPISNSIFFSLYKKGMLLQ